MIKIGDDGSWRKDVGAEIRRLEILLFDMNMLHSAGGYPPADELVRAQVIFQPTVEPRAVPSLVGLVGSSLRQTSPVVMMGDGWARTWNSLYRVVRD